MLRARNPSATLRLGKTGRAPRVWFGLGAASGRTPRDADTCQTSRRLIGQAPLLDRRRGHRAKLTPPGFEQQHLTNRARRPTNPMSAVTPAYSSRRRKRRNARKPSFSLVIAPAFPRPRTALLLWRPCNAPRHSDGFDAHAVRLFLRLGAECGEVALDAAVRHQPNKRHGDVHREARSTDRGTPERSPRSTGGARSCP